MFEAAMELLEQVEIEGLTTNAVAAKAGVSIGTLYQYFEDRQALLDALAKRELGTLSQKVLEAVQTPPTVPGDRIRRVVRASMDAYGGRSRAHRRLLEHSLTHSGGRRMSPLLSQLQEAFVSEGIAPPGETPLPLSRAQAFVFTHTLAGVVRSLAASDDPPPVEEVEEALVRMALAFLEGVRRTPRG